MPLWDLKRRLRITLGEFSAFFLSDAHFPHLLQWKNEGWKAVQLCVSLPRTWHVITWHILSRDLHKVNHCKGAALWSASEFLKLEASVNTGYLGTVVDSNYSDLRMLVGMHKCLSLPTASFYNLESSHLTCYWTEEKSTNKMCQVLTQKAKRLLALQIAVKLLCTLERHL